MFTKIKVHLIGGDGANWALDLDLKLTKKALSEIDSIELVDSPECADVIHSVNAEQLVIDRKVRSCLIPGKKVVAHFTSPPSALFEYVPGLYSESRNWICVAQTQEVVTQFNQLGISNYIFIPYVGDLETFYPLDQKSTLLNELRAKLNLPSNKYIIGSFQRDSMGGNLLEFKPQKGADVFMAIVSGVAKRVGHEKIHILLAGPRRHWLRAQLEKFGISYSFLGEITTDDDYPKNIVSLEQINELTALLDLYIVASRWEGAPQAVFETIAAKKKIISSSVAVSKDILDPSCLFSDIPSAIEIVIKDIQSQSLNRFIEPNYSKVLNNHSVKAVRSYWDQFYTSLLKQELKDNQFPTLNKNTGASWSERVCSGKLIKSLDKLSSFTTKLSNRKNIVIWGLSNKSDSINEEFLKKLSQDFIELGHNVLSEKDAKRAQVHLYSLSNVDLEKVKCSLNSKSSIVEFVDVQFSYASHQDKKRIQEICEFTRLHRGWSVFSSYFSWVESKRLGVEFFKPCIIRRATFLSNLKGNQSEFSKIKVASRVQSSDNAEVLSLLCYLDDTLDFDQIKLSVFSDRMMSFKNIQVQVVTSETEYFNQLSENAVYLALHDFDMTSQLAIDALSLKIPVVYRNAGSFSELVGFGGLVFDQADEIQEKLKCAFEYANSIQVCSYVKRSNEVAKQILTLC